MDSLHPSHIYLLSISILCLLPRDPALGQSPLSLCLILSEVWVADVPIQLSSPLWLLQSSLWEGVISLYPFPG